MSLINRFNSDLIDDISQRRSAIFVGAGASLWSSPSDGTTFQNWEQFLESAAATVKNETDRAQVSQLIKEKEYLFASELLKQLLDDTWEQVLENAFAKKAPVSRLHKAIVNLNSRILLTTNFDKLIESAWENERKDEIRFAKIVHKVDKEIFRLFRTDDSYIIKLHGTIDNTSSLVFDKTSYHANAIGNHYYNEFLSALLLTHTFLFIGFSMADPVISSIIEIHAHNHPGSRPHYIFQAGENCQIDALWKKHRRLSVIRYDPSDNHQELADLLEALGKECEARRRGVLASQIGKASD